MSKNIRVLVLLALLVLPVLTMGCASARLGRDHAPSGAVSQAAGIEGMDKESVILSLGDPDFVTTNDGSEFWCYRSRAAWNVNLYYATAGRTRARDLIIQFSGNRVKGVFTVDKGKSLGIVASPMSAPD